MKIREIIYSYFSDEHLYKLFDKYCEKLNKTNDPKKIRKIINGPIWDINGALIHKHSYKDWYNHGLENTLYELDKKLDKYRNKYRNNSRKKHII